MVKMGMFQMIYHLKKPLDIGCFRSVRDDLRGIGIYMFFL